MQEDYPGDDEHDNEYLDPDLTQSNSSHGEEDVLVKPEPPVHWSKGVLHKTVVPAPKKTNRADTTVLPQPGFLSRLGRVKIGGRVRIDGRVIRNTKRVEGFRFCWKESGILEGIRFHWMCCEYGMMIVQ
jgi:hypothetical protein